jgi:hypothetical protein
MLVMMAGTSFAYGSTGPPWGYNGPPPWVLDDDDHVVAPEIDPASATAWLTILGGMVAVMYGRRSKKP